MVLHKFIDYLLGNKNVFYVDHIALVYLVKNSQVSRRITKWLLLFLEYDFIIVYLYDFYRSCDACHFINGSFRGLVIG